MTERLRLQKYLSQCGVTSRRKSEDLIASGAVAVNGEVITKFGVKIDPDTDSVTVNGEAIGRPKTGLLLMHKPDDVITTRSDTHQRRTVMDLLPEKYQTYFPVGRLDYETTGLLIFTNDGELANRLLHPRYNISRTYIALVKGEVSDKTIKLLSKGVTLDDGFVKARARKLKADQAGTSRLELVLHVGRKRIVRRLLAHLGHPVLKLQRTQHGPFKLAGIKYGEFKEVPESEFSQLVEDIEKI